MAGEDRDPNVYRVERTCLPDHEADTEGHDELLVRNGIPHQESMRLAALAADLAEEMAATRSADEARRVYTFAYIYAPVPLKGATGSPGAPLAVR